MHHKKIKILASISLFFVFATTVAFSINSARATSETTEFATPPVDDAALLEQQKAKLLFLEQTLKGTMSDEALYAITRPTQVSGTAAASTGTGYVFSKNLKLGDTDAQVLALQKVLNRDTATVISTTGPGSLGNETTYFGLKTKTALIKFQNKYAKEVLIPNGLTVGTGYFGVSTRTLLNTLNAKTAGTTPAAVVMEKLTITALEPTHGKDGTVVTIRGTGITKTANKIIAGGVTVYNATSTDGKTLTFTMRSGVTFPVDSGMSEASTTYIKEHFKEFVTDTFPPLKYPVCISNDNGMSNCAFFTIDL
ncbi:MAG: hypothetical protein WCT49_00215 [Candidatus Paceibacterota bacterium]|nr:hypothetical protein [Candidatus Paceibacterota bacterium]